MEVRRVCRSKMHGSYKWITNRHGIAVPSLFLQGSKFTDAGFAPDEKLSVLVLERMLIIVPSSRLSAQAEAEVEEINRAWDLHQGRGH